MEIFSKNELRVKTYILALLPHWADADDVFADTNIRLWEQFDEYDPEKDFGAWACTIARYQVLSRRNQLRRERKILGDPFIDAVSETFSGAFEQSDRQLDALRLCLKKLTVQHRRFIREAYDGARSIAEIAESLGLTPSAFSMKLSRIRRKLHDCIQSRVRVEGRS